MSYVVDGTELASSDAAAIRAMIQPWTTACLQRDWDALLAMCTDDITFLPPNEPAVQADSVRTWLDDFPIIKAMEWDIDHIEGSLHLACLRGWVNLTLDVRATGIVQGEIHGSL